MGIDIKVLKKNILEEAYKQLSSNFPAFTNYIVRYSVDSIGENNNSAYGKFVLFINKTKLIIPIIYRNGNVDCVSYIGSDENQKYYGLTKKLYNKLISAISTSLGEPVDISKGGVPIDQGVIGKMFATPMTFSPKVASDNSFLADMIKYNSDFAMALYKEASRSEDFKDVISEVIPFEELVKTAQLKSLEKVASKKVKEPIVYTSREEIKKIPEFEKQAALQDIATKGFFIKNASELEGIAVSSAPTLKDVFGERIASVEEASDLVTIDKNLNTDIVSITDGYALGENGYEKISKADSKNKKGIKVEEKAISYIVKKNATHPAKARLMVYENKDGKISVVDLKGKKAEVVGNKIMIGEQLPKNIGVLNKLASQKTVVYDGFAKAVVSNMVEITEPGAYTIYTKDMQPIDALVFRTIKTDYDDYDLFIVADNKTNIYTARTNKQYIGLFLKNHNNSHKARQGYKDKIFGVKKDIKTSMLAQTLFDTSNRIITNIEEINDNGGYVLSVSKNTMYSIRTTFSAMFTRVGNEVCSNFPKVDVTFSPKVSRYMSVNPKEIMLPLNTSYFLSNKKIEIVNQERTIRSVLLTPDTYGNDMVKTASKDNTFIVSENNVHGEHIDGVTYLNIDKVAFLYDSTKENKGVSFADENTLMTPLYKKASSIKYTAHGFNVDGSLLKENETIVKLAYEGYKPESITQIIKVAKDNKDIQMPLLQITEQLSKLTSQINANSTTISQTVQALGSIKETLDKINKTQTSLQKSIKENTNAIKAIAEAQNQNSAQKQNNIQDEKQNTDTQNENDVVEQIKQLSTAIGENPDALIAEANKQGMKLEDLLVQLQNFVNQQQEAAQSGQEQQPDAQQQEQNGQQEQNSAPQPDAQQPNEQGGEQSNTPYTTEDGFIPENITPDILKELKDIASKQVLESSIIGYMSTIDVPQEIISGYVDKVKEGTNGLALILINIDVNYNKMIKEVSSNVIDSFLAKGKTLLKRITDFVIDLEQIK